MKRWILAIALVTFGADALGAEAARYRATRPAGAPAIDELLLTWDGGERPTSDATLRVDLSVGGRPLGTFWAEGSRDAMTEALDPSFTRYVWRAHGERAIEWRRSDGRAALPDPAILAPFLPRAGRGDAAPRLPPSILFLGVYLERREDAAAEVTPPGDVLRIHLDDDAFVATSRDFRDDGTGRHGGSGGAHRRGPGDYRYVPLAAADYRTMIDAGFNLFRIPPQHLPWIAEEPVWFVMEGGFAARPDVVFRANFLGAVMYMDEPAWRLLDGRLAAEMTRPQDAASLLVEITRGRLAGDGPYGRGRLGRVLVESGVGAGPIPTLRGGFPAWEAVPSAAWYEFEAGLPGVCLQGRVRPSWFATRVRRELGVTLPDDPEAMLRWNIAWLTGAARRFHGDWGMSVYGQMDSTTASRALPLAYDRGAKWLWIWTSDRDHHVAWERQLALARGLREHMRRSPRIADGVLPARLAVAVPWGYPFDEFCLDPPKGGRARLWNSPGMELDDRNAAGVRYRDVLAAIARAASRALATGDPFDILLLREGEAARGYERVIRVTETGRILEETGASR